MPGRPRLPVSVNCGSFLCFYLRPIPRRIASSTHPSVPARPVDLNSPFASNSWGLIRLLYFFGVFPNVGVVFTILNANQEFQEISLAGHASGH